MFSVGKLPGCARCFLGLFSLLGEGSVASAFRKMLFLKNAVGIWLSFLSSVPQWRKWKLFHCEEVTDSAYGVYKRNIVLGFFVCLFCF